MLLAAPVSPQDEGPSAREATAATATAMIGLGTEDLSMTETIRERLSPDRNAFWYFLLQMIEWKDWPRIAPLTTAKKSTSFTILETTA
jgi:hypothetical protein